MVAIQEAAFLNSSQKSGPEPVPERPRVSVFFPVYNDERTVERVALKSLDVCLAWLESTRSSSSMMRLPAAPAKSQTVWLPRIPVLE